MLNPADSQAAAAATTAAPTGEAPAAAPQQQEQTQEQPRRTYGKRELSQSKRAAQNRAAQV